MVKNNKQMSRRSLIIKIIILVGAIILCICLHIYDPANRDSNRKQKKAPEPPKPENKDEKVSFWYTDQGKKTLELMEFLIVLKMYEQKNRS